MRRRLQATGGRIPIRRLRDLTFLLGALVVVGMTLVAYVVGVPEVGSVSSTRAPPITVELGTPRPGQIDCGGSQPLRTEEVPWLNTSENVTTSQFFLKIVELYDGNYIGSQDPPATVTPSDLCAGNPPRLPFDWFAVLAGPSGGPNTAVFSDATEWTSVGNATQPASVAPGSALTIVSVRPFSNGGYGLTVEGVSGGPMIEGSVPL